MDARTRELLAELGLQVPPRRPVHELRVAEQQLVEVAKALALGKQVKKGQVLDITEVTPENAAKLYKKYDFSGKD